MKVLTCLALALLISGGCSDEKPAKTKNAFTEFANPKHAHKAAMMVNKSKVAQISGAIALYKQNEGAFPESLADLAPDYLDTLPAEATTHSREVVEALDGTGGWIYDSQTGQVMPNIK